MNCTELDEVVTTAVRFRRGRTDEHRAMWKCAQALERRNPKTQDELVDALCSGVEQAEWATLAAQTLKSPIHFP